ncbi:hypothetical protein [uncultured Roseobacter sp.]|uniref:hypothetical protein n=1 Tax=uncultured Roseobacter sp. TaxID=114847 RepID=UPI00261F23A1|nr:hypothetical protein [uncultured Roseobacter sp.]
MSLFVLSPDTVWNPGILSFPTAPRKILERGMILPRRDVSWGFIGRVIVENQVLRFFVALLPFGVAAVVWPAAALPVSQAPIAMLIVIGFVELRVLRIPREKRESMATEAEAARALDTLQFRGRRILAQFAARRGIETGTIYLVIEQSDMVRIPPMTVVSLQLDHGTSRLIPLSAEERALIRDTLFDAEFTERQLHLANQREGVTLRSVAFEARGVSAHARLAAFLDAPEKPAPV